ncbi:hypothetical protein IWX58_004792 [Rubrivivax gelatinosus]|nr:hypothetical protein [Rubrivivax gelatinosus]
MPDQHWVPAGKKVRFAGAEIAGPLYFGRPIAGVEDEPSAIDPTLPIAAVGDFCRVARALWASYKTLTARERRGYIEWLTSGRNHPDVDMRLVYMYFYGLERRLVVDLQRDPAISAELLAIEDELLRLREIYAGREQAFGIAADSLLHWVKSLGAPPTLYERKNLEFRRVYGLRVYTEVAVGQAVRARHPIHARLALAWVQASGSAYMTAECKALQPQFEALFEELFAAVHPEGMHIPDPPGNYELLYRPSSPALIGHPATAIELQDTVRTSMLTEPLQQLKVIFKTAQAEVERFAKLLKRRRGAPCLKLEDLQSLPMRLWPETHRASLRDLVRRVSQGSVLMRASEVLAAIHPETKFTKSSAQAVQAILQGLDLSTDPPLIGEGRVLKAETIVAVLPTELINEEKASLHAHARAVRALQAATAVAAADGCLPEAWPAWLEAQVDSWDGDLAGSPLLRVRARLTCCEPPAPAVFRKLAEGIDEGEASAIARLATRGACAMGEPSATSVKALQKLYQALGLDAKKVPGDLHAAASGQGNAAPTAGGFQLDDQRIALLQQDTQRVTEVLAAIFATEEQALPAQPQPAAPAAPETLFGLDAKHSQLACRLLTQPQWTRQGLLQAAAVAGLMPDGALERINDACFDLHDMPFFEGDDPIDINPDILEILS